MSINNNKEIIAQVQSAVQFLNKGETSAAQEVFDQIKDLPYDDVAAMVKLGVLASQLGEYVAAINVYTHLVEEYPDNASYLDSFAHACMNNGLYPQAESLFKKAIEINPEMHNPYMQLGYIAILQSRFSEAIGPLEKALMLKPSNPIIYTNLIIALTQAGKLDDAYKHAQKLIRLQPKKAEGYHSLGVVLKKLGRFDEAVTSFEKAIRLNKTLGTSYYDLVSSKKFSSDDIDFIKDTEKILQSSMPVKERAAIHFALGKIYNDCKEWGKAFEHYKQANVIGKPALLDTTGVDVFNKTHKVYTTKFFEQNAGLGSESETPVFVIGMPRSGTTLIEQIIRSHPEGAGAGELSEIEAVSKNICPVDKLNSYRQKLDKILNAEMIEQHAESYLKVLRHSREDASRIVDKMPDNFIFIGLIKTLFPKAHIIHAVRSPIDTCLSCYFMPFRGLSWTNDLSWIAERYVWYRKAMDYWTSVLPEGEIIEVNYDELVADPESQSKRLIESIGLEWDPVCLEFYKESSAVSTASFWQVRQPIYTSSSKRWINYAQYIEPLVTGMSAYLGDDDMEELEKHGIKFKKKWYSNIFQ